MLYQALPGVFDIVPKNEQDLWKNSHLWNYVEDIIRKTAIEYGFSEIRTPAFERTELFQRSVGDASDIVSKEMYTFKDKGDRSTSLRPEGTAPVMRAYLENNLDQHPINQKLFYIGPMFRYERAQAGRYRQHHQFGAEAIGNGSPMQDVEMIDLLLTVYNKLGLKNLSLFINSIGDADSRQRYKEALVQYLASFKENLSEDSKRRLETNPLRILDSKAPEDRSIVAKAPSILDFLNEESKKHFEEVKALLNALKIPFIVNPLLVRGIDYYNKTVFEITSGELGSQNSVGGGGRYDGLLKTLGGADLPTIGFGTGIERILQTLINQNLATMPKPKAPLLYLVAMGETAKTMAFTLLHSLRQKGIPASMDFSSKKVGKALQIADQLGCKFAVVIGDDEIKSNTVELKELSTGNKRLAPLVELADFMEFAQKNDTYLRWLDELNAPLPNAKEALNHLAFLQEDIRASEALSKQLENAVKTIKNII